MEATNRRSTGRGGPIAIAMIAAVAIALVGCSSSATPSAPAPSSAAAASSAATAAPPASPAAPVTLSSLFMKQAAYSDSDVKAMSDAFTAANRTSR